MNGMDTARLVGLLGNYAERKTAILSIQENNRPAPENLRLLNHLQPDLTRQGHRFLERRPRNMNLRLRHQQFPARA